jgi:hypothetical protein
MFPSRHDSAEVLTADFLPTWTAEIRRRSCERSGTSGEKRALAGGPDDLGVI